ncbi:helix-turn-helix domain-containing protein [Streptomyces fuscichromogenes]|uniref:helix-turn-helix domain-containing protein n=1 Tax=Streptomyces fuscichromogenes TaxID=1324013 RepID=UPI0037F3C14E
MKDHRATTDEGGLAGFLRSRRERLRPEQVGLPASGRRRTPGLRREELATLAGLSVEYLERLEQGRDTNPSVGVLAALAEALRLSDDEKWHLAMLAMKRHSATLFPAPHPVSEEPRPTVRALLDHLDPTPACLLGPIYNLVAWNRAWGTVVRPVGVLDEDRPNFLRYHFTNPMAHRIFDEDDWSAVADELVGWLRSAQPDWGLDDEFRDLVDDLAEVPEFARRWAAHPVAFRQPGSRRLLHPDAGTLSLTLEVLLVGEASHAFESNHWLQLWVPYDEQTASAISALVARHGSAEAAACAETSGDVSP